MNILKFKKMIFYDYSGFSVELNQLLAKLMKNMNIQNVSARAILAKNEKCEMRNKKLLSGCTCRVAKGDCGQGQSQGQVKVRHYTFVLHNILRIFLVGPLPLYFWY